MYGIIISAHCNYSSGVYSGIKLVAGEMENVRVVDYLEGETFEDLEKNLQEAFDSLSDYKKKIIITDLLGGTPFNRSVIKFSGDENVRVLTGLNFPLLYSAAIQEESPNMDEDIRSIIQMGKDGITVYEKPEEKEEQDEDFSDGI